MEKSMWMEIYIRGNSPFSGHPLTLSNAYERIDLSRRILHTSLESPCLLNLLRLTAMDVLASWLPLE